MSFIFYRNKSFCCLNYISLVSLFSFCYNKTRKANFLRDFNFAVNTVRRVD